MAALNSELGVQHRLGDVGPESTAVSTTPSQRGCPTHCDTATDRFCCADLLTSHEPAGTTTLAVHRQVGFSREVSLHHFGSREELLAAAVGQLVARNRQAAVRAIAEADADELVDRALNALAATVIRPEFSAELGLWAAARADPALRSALRQEARTARGALYEVVGEAFGPTLTAQSSSHRIASLTVQFLRGLSIAETLRDNPGRAESLIKD